MYTFAYRQRGLFKIPLQAIQHKPQNFVFLISAFNCEVFPLCKIPTTSFTANVAESTPQPLNSQLFENNARLLSKKAVTASCCFQEYKIQNLAEKITAHLSLYEGQIKDRKIQKGTDCHEENTGQQALKRQRNADGPGIAEMQKNVVQQAE